ncbi:MAG: (2Fe-2S) ferredoxin [Candidatus Kapaibacterium sp.]|nr:MAG: (2Fe-2S) ferredoxin [Candidatus Kapabacteria bacterium]
MGYEHDPRAREAGTGTILTSAPMQNGYLSEPTLVRVRLYGEERDITVEPGETILVAAIRASLDPPYSCVSGQCATCRAKLLSGTVTMDNNDVLTEEELAEGYILTCQAHPTAHGVSVDYDQ